MGVISGADSFLTDTFNVPAGNTVNRVEVPDNALLRPNGDFTVEAWVNLLNPTFDQHLVYKWDSGGSNFAFQLQVGLNGGPVAAFQRLNNVGAGGIVNGTTILLPNTWYHMVGVKSGANVLIYLNGTLEGTLGGIAGTIYANTPQALVIGATFFGGGGLNGREDEVRFSSVARPASWIQTEYNNVSNQGVGAGKFILSSLLDVASCCGLTTVETLGSTIAVTGTDQFALSFDASNAPASTSCGTSSRTRGRPTPSWVA